MPKTTPPPSPARAPALIGLDVLKRDFAVYRKDEVAMSVLSSLFGWEGLLPELTTRPGDVLRGVGKQLAKMQLNPMQSVNTLLLFLGKDTGDTEAGIAHYMTGRGLKRLTSHPAVALVPYLETVAEDVIELVQAAASPRSPVEIRPASSTGRTYIFPSPRRSVCASRRIVSKIPSTSASEHTVPLSYSTSTPAHTGLGCRNWASSGPSTLPDPHRRRAGYVRDISPRARLVTR